MRDFCFFVSFNLNCQVSCIMILDSDFVYDNDYDNDNDYDCLDNDYVI